MRKKLLWIAPLAILGLAFFAWVGGELVRLLWNWLLPEIFGWREITFWQALGLLVLCRILFGGFRLGGHRSPRSRAWRRMEERWDRMSPEERERCRSWFSDRWGSVPPPEDSKPGA